MKIKKSLGLFIFGIFLIFNINFCFGDTIVNNYYGSSGSFSGGGTGTQYSGGSYASSGNYNSYSTSSSYSGSSSGSFSGGSTGTSSGFDGVNIQYTNPSSGASYAYVDASKYWGDYGRENCNARQDIFMQIMPFGCSPAVVRSDLLEEQNVPVFCKVMSIQANPLIQISQIRSISFSGQYPKGISGVSYYPSRAALIGSNNGMRNLENNAVNTEMGYLVIVLSKQPVESNMSDYIEGNITANIDYGSEGTYGIGKNNFYLSEMSDSDWTGNYRQYGFWNGKGYIRAESIDQDRAVIGVYGNDNIRFSSVNLRRGEISKDIYLPGFYCAAGFNIRLESIGAPLESALLQINDQQVWVSKGDKVLDDKCRVSDLKTFAGGGKVILNCPGTNGRIELALTPGKASFSGGFGIADFAVGEKINEQNNIYLAYLGKDVDGRKFAVLIKDGFSNTVNEFLDKGVGEVIDKIALNTNKNIFDLKSLIKTSVENQYTKKLSNIKKEEIKSKVEIYVIGENEEALGLRLDSVSIAVDQTYVTSDSSSNQKLAMDYYDLSVNQYEDLADLYPSERSVEGEDSYAAIGLYEAGRLSKAFNMNAKAQEYYSRLMRVYPDSNVAKMISNQEDGLMKYDTTKSKSMIFINNQQYIIDLLDFKKPTKAQASSVLLIEGKEISLGVNDVYTINKEGDVIHIQLTELKDDYVVVKMDKSSGKNRSVSKTERITNNNGQVIFEGINVKLLNINLDKQVKVILTPKTLGTRAQSNFTFKIGIEKRAINLSTDQSKVMLDNLLSNIKKWNDINDKLGKVVKVMKGACFATSLVLTAKTYLGGLSGESMARGTLMKGKNGWNAQCEKLVSNKKYTTLQQCLLDKNSEVEKDVKIYGEQIKNTNDILKGIGENAGKTNNLFGGNQVDSKKVEEEFTKKFNEMCKGASGEVELPDKEKTKVPFTGSNGICNMNGLTLEQKRNIYTLNNVKNAGGSSVLNGVVNDELGKTVLEVKNFEDANKARIEAEKNSKDFNLNIKSITPVGDSVTMGDVKRIVQSDSNHPIYKNFNTGSYVIRVFIPSKKSFGNTLFEADGNVSGKEVIVEVTETKGVKGTYIIGNKIYTVDGKEVSGNAAISVKNYLSLAGINRIKQSDNKAYHNSMTDVGSLMVKYFENAPYKGLPAEIPFDVNEGWYVELTYVLSGFGKPYDESGRPINFYICNVGENGKIEFKQSADDICRYYNADTGADLSFPGMSSTESRNLVSKAISAITDAAKQYGKDRITINGHGFKSGTSFGGNDAGSCSDFMSPSDCNILFNVCDPVICPSSRCDLGGQYRVDNVIQSGIIGSLTLCLPNIREGIAVPICLSGVHAGLQNYISILNSTAQCLNESINTGKNIGICDEIKSIYICDFFWKQATPFLGLIIPKLVEGLYWQGTRGGGEYLTAKQSWENTQNAINFFTNQYAINSLQAFSQRNAETITTTDICKSFASFSAGGVSSMFKNLIEPDSPVQYNAWFSEDVLTTATLPPTSHYKVYYHIYAGTDIGASYMVYLKNPASVSSVNSIGYYTVARGYIARGGQVDEAKDFTGPGGFKQLCINVNGKEECGFGRVSTSYILDSLSDSYAKEQLISNIKSEKDCVSGTPSVYGMVNPNLQAGIEDSITGQLYNQGIIRVCASENPGKKVLASGDYDKTSTTYDRWKEVGYCDDTSIKCWLDTNSVKSVINNKAILNDTLQKVDLKQLGALDYWTADESMSVSVNAKNAIQSLIITTADNKYTISNKINNTEDSLIRLTKLGNNNYYRARGMYLLANLYRKVAEGLLEIKTIISETNELGQSNNIDSTLNYEKVEYYDIEGVDSDSQLYITVEGVKYEINSFDYEKQTVTLSDGSIKNIAKKDGKIIFINSNIKSSTTNNAVWKDDILKQNVLITANYLPGGKKIYRYSKDKGWFSDDNDFNLVNSASNMGYIDGINYIVKKTNFLGSIVIEEKFIDNSLFRSDSELAEIVFNALIK